MSALIGALRVSLSAETAQFEAGMKRAQRASQSTSASIKKSFAGIGNTIKAGLAGIVAGLSVGLFTSAIKGALDYAGSLGELAQQLGVTTRDLQAFRYAAGQSGLSQEELEKGLQKLTITLGQLAAGAKAPRAALEGIRKGLADQVLQARDTGDAFRLIADGLAQIPNRAERAAVEVALFGRAGAKLDTLLAGGSQALNELTLAAEELGIVLSDEQIQKADETADKLDALQTVMSAQIAGVVADNADSILGLASSIANLVVEIGKALGKVRAFYNEIAEHGYNLRIASIDFAEELLPGFAGGANRQKTRGKLVAARGNLRKQVSAQALEGIMSKGLKPSEWRNPRRAAPAISQFLASGGGGGKGAGKKDRSAEEAERKRLSALRDAYQFDQDLRRGQMDILQARRDLAHTAGERTGLEIQMLDLEKAGQQAELDYQVAAGEITEIQARQRKAQNEKADALKRQAVAENLAADRARDSVELSQSAYDLQLEHLQLEAGLAETAQERRAVELRILAVMKEQEKARLEAVIADKQSSELAKQQAQQRLEQLDSIYAGRQQAAIQGTRGPWETFVADTSDLTEEMQNLKVQGVEAVADTLWAATKGWDAFKEAGLSAIQSIIAELFRMQAIKMIVGMLGGIGGGGSAVAGGVSSSVTSNAIAIGNMAIPGFATGGGGILGGRGGVDRNLLSLNGIPIARVSRGEHLNVTPDGGGFGGGMSVSNTFHVSGNVSRETQMQIASKVRRSVADASKRNY
jgi:hypothetical protein